MNNNSNLILCDNIDFTSDQLFLSVLYIVVFCIGLPSNCMALYGLYRLVKGEDILPVFAINLLLSDLLQISTLPLWIDYYMNGHKWRFGEASCSIIGCTFFISLFVSIFFMCCISLERYLAVTRPLWFRRHSKIRNSAVFCLVLWVFVTVCTSVAFSLGFESSPNELCMEKYPAEKSFAVFQLFAMTISFILPLIFFLFAYCSIRNNISGVVSIPNEEKEKILLLLFLILVVFVVVFGPFHIICYVAYIGVLFLEDSCDYEASIFIYFQVVHRQQNFDS
ncbi:G-protein coupled receptor 4-like [Amia ocellicauda]|uniref:G-protein coupled receptor 4-like n=1 Tax=Amia ocellicauda TaxID=2972642 RepID=UPI00346475E8